MAPPCQSMAKRNSKEVTEVTLYAHVADAPRNFNALPLRN